MGNWRRPPDQATTTLVLNLDTTAPGVAGRLGNLYFTMFNLRRALQRDAQSLAKQYWGAKDERDALGWKAVAERLGISRSKFEARARRHFQSAGWASEHVSAALVSHMADGVFENLTRHLWSDASGKRHGPLHVTPYHEFATITGRARSHTTANKWETFRLYGSLQGHLDAYRHPNLAAGTSVEQVLAMGAGHQVARQRRSRPPAPQRWPHYQGPLVMVFAGGPTSTQPEMVLPVLVPTGSSRWGRLAHFLNDPDTWHKIDLVRRPDANRPGGWRYEMHLLVLNDGYRSPRVRDQLASAPRDRVACVDVNVSNLSVASRNLTMTSLKSTVVKVTEIEHERLVREALQNRRRQRSLDRSRRATNVAQYQKSQAQVRRDQRRAEQGLSEVTTLPRGARLMRTKEKPIQAYRCDSLSHQYAHLRTIHGARARAASITKGQAAWAISRELITIHGPNWIVEDCHLPTWSRSWGNAMAISAPGMVTSALAATCAELNGSYTKVSTATTALSSTCLCGARVKKDLGERVHRCASCGLVGDRDLVSAALGTCVTPVSYTHLDVYKRQRLVYGRMTGYGQQGPLSLRAGHDINYIAVSGALWPIGRAGEKPVVPLNLVGDFGGGALFLAFGVVSAVLCARDTGEGQVVDAAMVDGSASMMAMTHALLNSGNWHEERGVNLLDSGAPFYEVYETSDHGYVAVGAIEAKFYVALLEGLGLDGADLPAQMDRAQWPAMKERFAGLFAARTRDEWTAAFADLDACVAPVLSPREAAHHPYNTEREVFATDDVVQPRPAPRFSRTPGAISRPPRAAGSGTREGLASWGIGDERQSALREAGAFG